MLEQEEFIKITDLTKNYADAHVLTTVDKKDYGSKHRQHYELGGR